MQRIRSKPCKIKQGAAAAMKRWFKIMLSLKRITIGSALLGTSQINEDEVSANSASVRWISAANKSQTVT
eukprot:scaffold99655_cov35-Prasinocladus_malaysianus.AAC.1